MSDHRQSDNGRKNAAQTDFETRIMQDNIPQADPELRLSEGRASPGQIAAVAVAAAVILFVVFYGLNHYRIDMPQASGPAATQTSGAAPAPNAAATGQDVNTGSAKK